MGADGSFPGELSRTKPYNYSTFAADNMANVCAVLSTPEDNLWEFQLEDGRGMRKAAEFIVPYMADIEKWLYAKDVRHFEEFPSAMSFLLFAGVAYGNEEYIRLWAKLAKKPQGDEIRRNIAIRQPFNWLTRL